MFDALKTIFLLKEKILIYVRETKIKSLTESDFEYIEEYLHCMAPLAKAIDFLQREKNCFYGILLLKLISLRNKMTLLKTESLKYCRPIVNIVIQKLNERFLNYCNVEGEGKNAAIAALTHLEMKKRWFSLVFSEMQTKIENLIFEAAETEETPVSVPNHDEDIIMFDDFSDGISGPNCSTFESVLAASSSHKAEVMNYLSQPCTKNYLILHQYPTVKKLFLKYNTPLPSSAPVERLFNYAVMFNLPKFNRQTKNTFERRVLMKANKVRF